EPRLPGAVPASCPRRPPPLRRSRSCPPTRRRSPGLSGASAPRPAPVPAPAPAFSVSFSDPWLVPFLSRVQLEDHFHHRLGEGLVRGAVLAAFVAHRSAETDAHR